MQAYTTQPSVLIQLLLLGGAHDKLTVATIEGWSGALLAAPRVNLRELLGRKEAHSAGVYLLLGPDSSGARSRVYVGEASSNVARRLASHHLDERGCPAWNRAIVATDSRTVWTRAQTRWLEATMLERFAQAPGWVVANRNRPKPPALSEMEKVAVERHLGELLVALPAVGVALQPHPDAPDPEATRGPRFRLNRSNASASGWPTGRRQFLVAAGSILRSPQRPNTTIHAPQYEILRAMGLLKATEVPRDWMLTRDHEFRSDTMAASMVVGYTQVGGSIWVNDEGETLREWRRKNPPEDPINPYNLPFVTPENRRRRLPIVDQDTPVELADAQP